MRFSLVFVFLLLTVSSGCGDGSDVPEELRAPPQTPATPQTADPDAPKGAAAVESPF